MIPFSISPTWIIAGVAALAVGGYVLHCEHVKSNWQKAKAIAEEQDRANAKQALRDLQTKERSDENYARNLARLAADVKRLRHARTSLLPAPSPSSTSPDRACFDRGELDAALRRYRDGVIGLVEEGAKAVEGLDEAKAWVGGRM